MVLGAVRYTDDHSDPMSSGGMARLFLVTAGHACDIARLETPGGHHDEHNE